MATSTEYQRKQQEWLEKKLKAIRDIKEPSDIQRLFLILAENPRRTTEEGKQFDALLKSVKAEERAETARIAARAIVTAKSEADRKARNHRLIERGSLSDLAGLQDMDPGEFLGALLGLSKVPPDDPRRQEWKRAGDTLLAERSELKKGSRKKGGDTVDTAPQTDEVVEQANYG
jgi:hypothetical protein